MRDQLRPKIVKRLREVRDWLNLSDAYLDRWIVLGTDFNAWVCETLKRGDVSKETLGSQFPIVWDQFLQATGAVDRFEFEEKQS